MAWAANLSSNTSPSFLSQRSTQASTPHPLLNLPTFQPRSSQTLLNPPSWNRIRCSLHNPRHRRISCSLRCKWPWPSKPSQTRSSSSNRPACKTWWFAQATQIPSAPQPVFVDQTVYVDQSQHLDLTSAQENNAAMSVGYISSSNEGVVFEDSGYGQAFITGAGAASNEIFYAEEAAAARGVFEMGSQAEMGDFACDTVEF